jgi:hypothetical protein
MNKMILVYGGAGSLGSEIIGVFSKEGWVFYFLYRKLFLLIIERMKKPLCRLFWNLLIQLNNRLKQFPLH